MKKILFFAIWIIVIILMQWTSNEIRKASQKNRTFYEVMMTVDLLGFTQNGGGSFGYQNYYKWQYATWINSPERTKVQRIMFWKVGFFYDATNPSEEYKYPLL